VLVGDERPERDKACRHARLSDHSAHARTTRTDQAWTVRPSGRSQGPTGKS
jgi:hypothetical protein